MSLMNTTPGENSEADAHFMRIALQEARQAEARGEVPVGAVIVDKDGTILAQAGNRSIIDQDPAGHAELIAIRTAGKKKANYRLLQTTLYTTIEPCIMCAGAMIHARIARLVYGAADPKAGAINSIYTIGSDKKLNHQIQVAAGILASECAELLSSFFKRKRS